MHIWLLISKAERQEAGARAKANEHKIPPTSVREAGGTPPSRKAGEGDCIVEVARQRNPPPLLSGWHLRTLSQPQNKSYC